MWWKKQKQPESQYHAMALGFLAKGHSLRFDVHCTHCDAYQSIYLARLIAEHGKTAIFRDIEPKIPCLFCKTAGWLEVRILSD